MNKTFNLYCDESCHLENDNKSHMFLGSVSVAYNQLKHHTQMIKLLKQKHNFYGEIKWKSVSKSKQKFYSELIDYFFNTDMQFRTVGVKKCMFDPHLSHSFDDFYYKMYYVLLNYRIHSLYSYNVYLDIKDTLSAYKVNRLKSILNTKYGVFRNVQNMHSHESIFIQLTDFLMGAISYEHNNILKKNQTKVHLINKIKSHCGSDLSKTFNHHHQFNLFFIDLQ